MVQMGMEMGRRGQKKIDMANRFMVLDITLAIYDGKGSNSLFAYLYVRVLFFPNANSFFCQYYLVICFTLKLRETPSQKGTVKQMKNNVVVRLSNH